MTAEKVDYLIWLDPYIQYCMSVLLIIITLIYIWVCAYVWLYVYTTLVV